jgi:hypothetical protein
MPNLKRHVTIQPLRLNPVIPAQAGIQFYAKVILRAVAGFPPARERRYQGLSSYNGIESGDNHFSIMADSHKFNNIFIIFVILLLHFYI